MTFRLTLAFLIALCSFPEQAMGQPVIATGNYALKETGEGIELTHITHCFIDSTKQLAIKEIVKSDFIPTDFSGAMFHSFDFGRQNLWYRFFVANTEHDTMKAVIHCGRTDILELYSFHKLSMQTRYAGFGLPLNEVDDHKIPYGFTVLIPPGDTAIYYVKMENFFRLLHDIRLSLYTTVQYEHYKAEAAESRFPFLVIQSCFLACMLFMFLFTILQFSSNYYRGYVFYSMFVLVNFFIFLRVLEYNANLRFITSVFPGYFYCFENFLTALALIFYLKFVEYFLETHNSQGYFQRFIDVAVKFLIILMAFDALIILFRPYAYSNIILYLLEKIIIYGILFAALIQVFFNKNPLTRYIIIGTVALLAGIVYASYLAVTPSKVTSSLMMPSNFAETGVILEILFFSVGLGYKSRVVEREKNKAQEQLITQLQENQKLQLVMNEQLEIQVKKRTDEVLRINKHYEEQRIQQIQSDFQKKIIETEMAALRAQMNPHFIFNCLNSINLFILKSEPDIASDYLTKFSRLIRLVLDNSRAKLVTLSNEITAIKLYIEMEALRFANKFGYEITIDDNIDIDTTEIPPMLLQPYVENAIWHGLMQYNGEGKIRLHFSRRENLLTAIIDDNGIGRDLAQRMKSKTAIEHKSHGMKVTAERIDMINRIYDTLARVEIIDKVGNTGIAFGTTVKIEIPLKRQN